MSWVVDAFGDWYLAVYPHRDGSEADQLIRTLQQDRSLEGVRILDVGCGPGRHLRAFAAAGAHPWGLDLSPQLLREAHAVRRDAQGRWPLLRGDMRRLPVRAAAFDAVTSLFTSFGYFGGEEDRTALAEAARALRPGGFHLLDFLNRERVLAHPNPNTERRAGDWTIREDRRIERGRLVVKRVRVHPAAGGEAVADYEERVTLYTPEELRGMLEDCGLTPEREWGEYDGRAFDAGASSRHVIVSRRGTDAGERT